METVLVVVIQDSILQNVYRFDGDHDEISAKAEKKFLDICNTDIWNFNEYTPDDIETILEQGYEQWDNNSVCIHWLD